LVETGGDWWSPYAARFLVGGEKVERRWREGGEKVERRWRAKNSTFSPPPKTLVRIHEILPVLQQPDKPNYFSRSSFHLHPVRASEIFRFVPGSFQPLPGTKREVTSTAVGINYPLIQIRG
jgi:hypothetical protein